MRGIGLMAAALAARLAGLAIAHEGHHDEAKETKAAAPTAAAATAQGEVVDMVCYLSEGEHGKDHAKCGDMCLLGGMPAGLLRADGSVLLLLENHDKPKAYKEVCKRAGQQISVTGKAVSRGGVNGFVVDEIKK